MLKKYLLMSIFFGILPVFGFLEAAESVNPYRVGVIGTTTSHVPAFVGVINDPNGEGLVRKYEVVAAYAGGMPDNPDSWNRVGEYSQWLSERNIPLYDTVEEMLQHVDFVLLESVDGRPHLEQAKPVIAAGIPLYIDKPIGGTLADSLEIFRLAQEKKVPVFSASSLRYSSGMQKMRNDPPVGKVFGCEATSPSPFNEKHPDLFWYGIHGVETLFTIMGPGCKSVSRTDSDSALLAVGLWEDGRIGSFRGILKGRADYGAKVFGEKGIVEAGTYEGYKPLVDQILMFFETGKSPVDPRETIEILAFMEASDESVRQGGKPISIEETIEKAKSIRFATKNILLKADGSVELEGKKVESSDLPALMKPQDGVDQVRIILKSEKDVPLERVKEICDLCDSKTIHLANYLY